MGCPSIAEIKLDVSSLKEIIKVKISEEFKRDL